MKKLIVVLLAAMFAGASISAIAAEQKAEKKPSAEDCKKDPKLKGCPVKK